MNKIIITKEQLDKILAWRDKNKELVRNFKPFIMSGEIMTEDKSVLCFNIEQVGSQWQINVDFNFVENGKRYDCIKANAVTVEKGYVVTEKTIDSGVNITDIDQSLTDIYGCLFAINAYFFHYRTDISQLETKRVEKHSKIVKGKYRYENVKVLERKYTIQGKIRNNKIPLHRAWHIDCWDVTGHIRHYQNGREVYIKPYKKGKNRNAETNNIYKIERYWYELQ